MLKEIAQSIAFADDMKGEVDRLIKEGYVSRIDAEGREGACGSRCGSQRGIIRRTSLTEPVPFFKAQCLAARGDRELFDKLERPDRSRN